jgi:hypothetical protein
MSGCGDGGALTSYSCFCYASSAAFASIISTAVVENCTQATPTPQLEASSAVQVFSSYCQLGTQLGYPNPSATSASVIATSKSVLPATRTSAAATSPSVSNAADQSRGRLRTGGGVGIGIIVGLFCAGVAFGLFLLRQRSKNRQDQMSLKSQDDDKHEEEHDQYHEPKSEVEAKPRPELPSEWTSTDTMTELPARESVGRGYELP